VSGRSYLLSGRDDFWVDGRRAGNPTTYDARNPNEGPFRVAFVSAPTGDVDGELTFDNRAQGTVPQNRWRAGRGRRIDVHFADLFVTGYTSFLDGLVPGALAKRYKVDVGNVSLAPGVALPRVNVLAEVTKDGLVLRVRLDNVRAYRATIVRDPVRHPDRVIVVRGRLRERARFSGPVVQ